MTWGKVVVLPGTLTSTTTYNWLLTIQQQYGRKSDEKSKFQNLKCSSINCFWIYNTFDFYDCLGMENDFKVLEKSCW